jgi:hypothetical protein
MGRNWSAEEVVDFLELRDDVDVGLADGHAIAAGDAGGAVLGEGLVFGPGTGELVVIHGVTLVAEDIGDGDVL